MYYYYMYVKLYFEYMDEANLYYHTNPGLCVCEKIPTGIQTFIHILFLKKTMVNVLDRYRCVVEQNGSLYIP